MIYAERSKYPSCFAAAGKKKNVNVGRGGGSAGLDDYQYGDLDDDGGLTKRVMYVASTRSDVP